MKTTIEKIVVALLIIFSIGFLYLANEINDAIKDQGLKAIAEEIWYGKSGRP